MKSCSYALLALVALVALSGCAGVKVKRVTPENDADTSGFRYYMPKPYLLVKPSMTTSSEKLEWEITYLPDYSKEYAVEPYQYLSSNSTELTFNAGGTLSGTTSAPDSSAVAAALIEQLGNLASLRVNNVNDGAQGRETPVPEDFILPAGLYELMISDSGAIAGVKRVEINYDEIRDEVEPSGSGIRFLTNPAGMLTSVLITFEDNSLASGDDPALSSSAFLFRDGEPLNVGTDYVRTELPRGLLLTMIDPALGFYDVHVVPIDAAGNVGRLTDAAANASFPSASDRAQLTPTASAELVFSEKNKIVAAVITLDPRKGGQLDPDATEVSVLLPDTVDYDIDRSARSIILTFDAPLDAVTIVTTPVGPSGVGAPVVTRHPAPPKPAAGGTPQPTKPEVVVSQQAGGHVKSFRTTPHATDKKIDEAATRATAEVKKDGKKLTLGTDFTVAATKSGDGKVFAGITLNQPTTGAQKAKYDVSVTLVLEGGDKVEVEPLSHQE